MSGETHNVSRTIEVSIAHVGLDGGIARTITVAFGQLAAQPYWDNIQNKPTFAAVATSGSYNDLSNKPNLAAKQDLLISGVNIKTINEYSILGSGNINIQGGGGTSDAVLYTEQRLSIKQQEQARKNIGAGTSDFNGSYDSLTDKPTNVSVFANDAGYLTQHQDISGKEDKANKITSWDVQLNNDRYPTAKLVSDALAKKYELPVNGIPASDIAEGVIPTVPTISTDIDSDATSDVKTASPKAVKTYVDNAIPSVPVQDVTVGGTSVVNNGTAVIPAIPDVTNCIQKSQTAGLVKNDGTIDTNQYGTYSKPSGGIPASDLESGVIPTVPTISTDIETDKASDAKTASPKAVYDEVHPATGSSQPSGGMLPNKLYKLGTLSGSITISLASQTDNTIENEYRFTFTADSTAPTITWPNSVTKWIGNSLDNGAPKVEASTYYEVSIQDGYGIFNAY